MNDIAAYFLSFFTGAGFVGFLVYWGLNHLDKVERLMAWFYRTFSWAYRRWEYGRAATDIQVVVNTVSEAINNEAQNALPHAMKIEWAKTAQDAEAFLRNGEIIVTIGQSQNRDRNLAVATITYLGKGLLPRARPYIDKILMRATDLTVAKRMFLGAGQSTVMSFFFSNYLEPEMAKEPQLRSDCIILDTLEEAGFFSRILLRQLGYLGDKAFPATPDETLSKESRDFVEFLAGIATKQRGEHAARGLMFARPHVRASVMLVAREETKKWGTEAYDRRTNIILDNGIENLYICARGADNISLAEQVAREQEKAGRLRILTRQRFFQTADGKRINAICIVCSLNLMIPSRVGVDLSSVVYRLLEEHVEELNDGLIEVVAIARIPGIKSKVAVRSLADGLDAVSCCSVPERLKVMEAVLGDERVEFIEWCNDPKSMIVASLTPLDAADVVEVTTDTEKRQASVKVNGWKAKRKALGRGDQNLACAMKLFGWHIEVEEAPKKNSKEPTINSPN